MAKLLIFVVLFILFTLVKLLIEGSKMAVKVGGEAFEAVYGDSTTKQSIRESAPHGIVGMLTIVAKRDGRISEPEARIIQRVIDQLCEIVPYESKGPFRESLLFTHREAKSGLYLFPHYLELVYKNIDGGEEVYASVVWQMIAVASLDGMSREKKELIYKAAYYFKIDRDTVDGWIASMSGESSYENFASRTANNDFDPYEILESDRGDSFETIKRKYRELIRRFHPDTIQAQGLDETFVELAKRKTQEINRAFAMIKEEYGSMAA